MAQMYPVQPRRASPCNPYCISVNELTQQMALLPCTEVPKKKRGNFRFNVIPHEQQKTKVRQSRQGKGSHHGGGGRKRSGSGGRGGGGRRHGSGSRSGRGRGGRGGRSSSGSSGGSPGGSPGGGRSGRNKGSKGGRGSTKGSRPPKPGKFCLCPDEEGTVTTQKYKKGNKTLIKRTTIFDDGSKKVSIIIKLFGKIIKKTTRFVTTEGQTGGYDDEDEEGADDGGDFGEGGNEADEDNLYFGPVGKNKKCVTVCLDGKNDVRVTKKIKGNRVIIMKIIYKKDGSMKKIVVIRNKEGGKIIKRIVTESIESSSSKAKSSSSSSSTTTTTTTTTKSTDAKGRVTEEKTKETSTTSKPVAGDEEEYDEEEDEEEDDDEYEEEDEDEEEDEEEEVEEEEDDEEEEDEYDEEEDEEEDYEEEDEEYGQEGLTAVGAAPGSLRCIVDKSQPDYLRCWTETNQPNAWTPTQPPKQHCRRRGNYVDCYPTYEAMMNIPTALPTMVMPQQPVQRRRSPSPCPRFELRPVRL